MLNIRKFLEGLRIIAKTTLVSDTKGELEVEDSSGKLNYHNGSSRSPIVTESHSATFTNKTIDANGTGNNISNLETADLASGVLNIDDTLTGATDTQIPSALAVKTYIESSTDDVQADVDDLITLSGVAANSTDLGTFTGTTIPDGSDNKEAFQALETGLEAHISDSSDAHAASAITNTPAGTIAATTVQAAINELDGDVQTVQTNLTNHINDATDAHAGTAITNTPAGTIAATTVQAAINELDGDIQAHITDTTDAHDASAISVSPSGNLSSTDVQSALIELQTDVDGKLTGAGSSTDEAIVRFNGTSGASIQNSVVTVTDAGIMSGATQLNVDNLRLDGNVISSTDTNGNIDLTPNGSGLINSNKDSRFFQDIAFEQTTDSATGANATLSTPSTKHIRLTNASLTSVDMIPAGSEGQEIVLINATGVDITINDNTGGTAADRILTGTKTSITLKDEASIPLIYDSTETRWMVAAGTGSGGGQAPEVFVQLDATELLSGWSTGDNATFLGGGTISGTFAKETSSPLNGTASYTYTQASGSLNDYMASPVQSVPIRFRGTTCSVIFPYTYNGNNSDIALVVWDVTNGAKLTDDVVNALPAVSKSIYKANIAIPTTCTQIRVGFQTKVENSGKILQFDDIQVSADTTRYADPSLITDWQSYTPTLTGFGTPSSVDAEWRRVGGGIEVRGKFTSGTSTGVEARVSLPNSHTSAGTTIIPSVQICGKVSTTRTGAKQLVALIEPNVAYFTFGADDTGVASGTKQNGSTIASSGNVLSFFASIPVAGLSASNPMIVTASESFSTDTASLVYAGSATYTPSTLADAPVGTFITYTYAINTNTRTQTTTAPTQTTSDMNVDGILLYTRAYNAASTAAQPAIVSIQVGKNFKGDQLQLFKSTDKTTAGDINWKQNDAFTSDYGCKLIDYNATTGILTIDAGVRGASNTSANFLFEDLTTQASGYVVVNASKSPALVGVPQVRPRIATISDVKAVNTSGGGFTSGAFQTRTLNTLDDPTGIVTSLSANQFVLPAGEYYIEAAAPAALVDGHKAKLRNITDSTDTIIGTTGRGTTGSSFNSLSLVYGKVVITASKTFEIQHRCQTTNGTDGFGMVSNVTLSEVYTTVKITRVK